MTGPRILATDGKFRLVRVEEGERVSYVLEKQDGFDALGCERWKETNVGSGEGLAKQLRDWIVTHALSCSHMKEQSQ